MRSLVARQGLNGRSGLLRDDSCQLQEVAAEPEREERISWRQANDSGGECRCLKKFKAWTNQGAPPGEGPGTAEPLGRDVPGVNGETPI